MNFHFNDRAIKVAENVLLILFSLFSFNLIFIHIMVSLVTEWAAGWMEKQWFMGNVCAVHKLGSLVYHWSLPHNPPPVSELCPLTAALLVAICCRDNHRGSSWPYDKLTLALTGEAFLLMHTGTLTCRSTLFDRKAQIQTRSDMNTHTQTVLVHFALPCHCTAQVGVSLHCHVHRLSCFMIGSSLLELCVHWLKAVVVCLCGNITLSSLILYHAPCLREVIINFT